MSLLRTLLAFALFGAGCTGQTGTGQDPSPAAGTPSAVRPSLSPSATDPSPSPSATPKARPPRQIVWVAVEDEQRVVKVDVGARRVLRSYRVSGRPHNIYAGRIVATALQAAGRIALIHGRSVMHVELGGSPHDVKGAGELLVVANEGAARVDVVSMDGDFLGSISLKANPHDLAIAPDHSAAWVSLDGSDDLAVVDFGKREVLRYASTGRRPHDLLFTPDGRLWVTDWNGDLHVFSKTGKALATVPLGMEAHHLAYTPRLRAGGSQKLEVWITDHEARRVFVVDGGTFEVLASLPMEGSPHHVAITPNGRWAVVADHDRGSVVVFSVARHKRVAEIPVGAGPHGVWAAP